MIAAKESVGFSNEMACEKSTDLRLRTPPALKEQTTSQFLIEKAPTGTTATSTLGSTSIKDARTMNANEEAKHTLIDLANIRRTLVRTRSATASADRLATRAILTVSCTQLNTLLGFIANASSDTITVNAAWRK